MIQFDLYIFFEGAFGVSSHVATGSLKAVQP